MQLNTFGDGALPESGGGGAIGFLMKPFSELQLSRLGSCYAALTPREREVMTWVVAGLLNKQIAGELGISEITVKAHRGQVMRKMKADSVPHLVRMAALIQEVVR